METKELVALALLVVMLPVGIAIAAFAPRSRDVAMFLVAFGTTIIDRVDISFLYRAWYRGTSQGFDFSWIDALVISVLWGSIFRRGGKGWYWVGGLAPFTLYWLYCLVSVLISAPKLFGAFELSKMLSGFGVLLATALYVRGDRELLIVLRGLVFAAIYESVAAIMDRYVYSQHRVDGTFVHANIASMYLCMLAPVLLGVTLSNLPVRLRRLALLGLALAAVAIILTISRTGVATLVVTLLCATVAFVPFKITAKRLAIGFTVVVLVTAAGVKSWRTLSSRYGEVTLEQEYSGKKTEGRGYYLNLARLMVSDHPFGVGLNNWSYYATNKYGPLLGMPYRRYIGTSVAPDHTQIRGSTDHAQAAPAHSLVALTMGELGWMGLVLFGALWLRWFQMGASFLRPRSTDPLRRIGAAVFFSLCAAFLHSLTEWEFRCTPLLYLVHLLIGLLAALYRIKAQARPHRAASLRP